MRESQKIGKDKMNFIEYIIHRIKYFWFIYLLNRQCGMCMGSNGRCDECNEWKNLYRRNWKLKKLKRETYWPKKKYRR